MDLTSYLTNYLYKKFKTIIMKKDNKYEIAELLNWNVSNKLSLNILDEITNSFNSDFVSNKKLMIKNFILKILEEFKLNKWL